MSTNLPSAATRWGVVGSVGLASAAIVAVAVAGIQGIVDLTEQELVVLLTGVSLLSVFSVGAVLSLGTRRQLDRLRGEIETIADGRQRTDHPWAGALGPVGESLDRIETRMAEQRTEIDRLETGCDNLDTELRTIERTVDQYGRTIAQCADGDLDGRLTPPDNHEGLAAVATSFNRFIENIQETITDVEQSVAQVSSTSRAMTDDAVTVQSASKQVSRSMQKINEGADEQSEALSTVTGEMESLSTTTEEIAASSNEVADIAERTSQTGQEGREAAQKAIAGMNEIETESKNAVEQIERLEAEVNQIDDLIEGIQEVATQTNMLALNANIEASRGGQRDEGKGFSVVAEEVKDLSEDAKEAAEEIEERLESIQDQTRRSAEEVESTATRIETVTGSVSDAVTALDEIATYAERTNEGVQEISAATEQQAASTEEVVSIIEEASSIAEETSKEADNVAAAATDQTDAMGSITNNARQLTDRATRLAEALERFGVDAEDLTVALPEPQQTRPGRDRQERDQQGRTPGQDGIGTPRGDRAETPLSEDARSDRPGVGSSGEGQSAAADPAKDGVDLTRDTPDETTPDAAGSSPDDGGAGRADAPSGGVDAYELRQAVIDAYPGDEPPWHALARIQLKTSVDLENVEPGDTIPEERFDTVLEAAREVTGREIDRSAAAIAPTDHAGAGSGDGGSDFGTTTGVAAADSIESGDTAAADSIESVDAATADSGESADTPAAGSADSTDTTTASTNSDTASGFAGFEPAGATATSQGTADAYELKQAVIDAYPGDEPPWHALARIQLKTSYDLENVEPGDRLPADRRDEIVRAAREVTGSELTLQQ